MSPSRGAAFVEKEASVTLPWNEMAEAGLIPQGGTAARVKTGAWRTGTKPVLDLSRCIHCLRCWIWCPDAAVLLEGEKVVAIDYEHCKGCGICAQVCPPKVHAIEMVPEGGEG